GLDDDPLDAQVVPPHLLDELGVVLALDPDAAAAGHARPLPDDGARARRRARRGGGGARRHGRREDDGLAVDPEPRAERERPRAARAVLEHDDVHAARLLDADHGADPSRLDLLDHEPAVRGLRPRHRSRAVVGGGGRAAEDVGAVAVEGHDRHPRTPSPRVRGARARVAPGARAPGTGWYHGAMSPTRAEPDP